MMRHRAPAPVLMRVALALALIVGGWAAPASAQTAPGQGWRAEATRFDRERLREWRIAWVEALQDARRAGQGRAIAAEGVLLDPDAGLPDGATPAAGTYRCRTIKLGAGSAAMPAFTAYPSFRCRVTAAPDGRLRFVKLTGSQRPIGTLYPDSPRRMVFLGTLQLGDEAEAIRYGADRERDTPAFLERIGPQRWRLVFPRPAFESIIDVMELVPDR